MTDLAKKLLLPLTLCLAITGCNTVSDVTPTQGGDLDWGRAIADGVVADIYGEGLVMFEVEATHLDISGSLYGGVQHPFWRFWYITPDIVIQVVVYPDGSSAVTEYYSYYYDEIMFTYTAADVRDWLALARYCYRYVTGREDDVCYGFDATCREFGSTARIYLFDATFDRLARVYINMTDGTIEMFSLY